jgi:hypothetical protein
VNISQLEQELDRLGIAKNRYSINGHLAGDTYVLNQVYSKWEYFYFDEKGNRIGYRNFDHENDACEYLLEKFKNELKYPSSVFKKWK